MRLESRFTSQKLYLNIKKSFTIFEVHFKNSNEFL